jgi:hypothetical protein
MLAVEYDHTPLTLYPVAPRVTPAHRWLAEHAGGGALLILPTGSVHPCVHARYLYNTTAHWLPLVSGYSGHTPPEMAHADSIGAALPAPEAIARARRRGIRWLVVEWEQLVPEQRQAFEAARADETLVPVATFAGESVYDLGSSPP